VKSCSAEQIQLEEHVERAVELLEPPLPAVRTLVSVSSVPVLATFQDRSASTSRHPASAELPFPHPQ
jgi:hypothetical protein